MIRLNVPSEIIAIFFASDEHWPTWPNVQIYAWHPNPLDEYHADAWSSYPKRITAAIRYKRCPREALLSQRIAYRMPASWDPSQTTNLPFSILPEVGSLLSADERGSNTRAAFHETLLTNLDIVGYLFGSGKSCNTTTKTELQSAHNRCSRRNNPSLHDIWLGQGRMHQSLR